MYQLKTIGTVRTGDRGTFIQLEPEVREGLSGLGDFSHVQVYWWAHQLDVEEMREIVIIPKPYKLAPEELGVFATRSPVRPNPLAMTLVPVTFVDQVNGIVGIAFIDAEPGTPVLDIKPYYGMERVKEYRVPKWSAHWPQWYEDAGDFDWAAEFVNAR
jgi:tRNA-Thr(GGU) m(6)t(6)A37 methyltransferase TsaA